MALEHLSLTKFKVRRSLSEEEQIEEEQFRSRTHRIATCIVRSKWLDSALGVIIMANIVIMIIETNRFGDKDNDKEANWTSWVGLVILMVFVAESIMRLYVFCSRFWTDPWNIFDFLVVLLDTFFTMLTPILGNVFPVSVLRIFRLSKIARISKMLRVFPELRLMAVGLVGSVSAIFWGCVLLFVVLLVWAMIAVNFIHPLNKDIAYGGCDRCPRAFESVEASLLTFFQEIVTGDSWGQVSIPIIEAHPHTSIYFALVYVSVGIGVVNLMVGVVVGVFTEAHDTLKNEAKQEGLRLKMEAQSQLLRVCKGIQSLDVEEDDIEVLWYLLDTEKYGNVAYSEFVTSVYNMKMSETHFLLVSIKYYVTMLKHAIIDHMEDKFKTVQQQVGLVEKEERDILDILGTGSKSPTPQDNSESVENKASFETDLPRIMSPLQLECKPSDRNLPRLDPIEQKDGQFSSELLSLRSERFEQFFEDSSKMRSELLSVMKDFRIGLDQQVSSMNALAQDLQLFRKPVESNLVTIPDRPVPLCCASSWSLPDTQKGCSIRRA